VQLEKLYLENNPHINGSLQVLQAMSELRRLDVEKTNIQVTLAVRQLYLPAELE
jgi:hypothetical protein